jgi:hypothetical protein
MGIYEDTATILGLRINIEKPPNSGDFFVEYEFTGDDWKENAMLVLPHFIGKAGVMLQTLHPFSSSHNLTTNQTIKTGNLWLNNPYFTVHDLLPFKTS